MINQLFTDLLIPVLMIGLLGFIISELGGPVFKSVYTSLNYYWLVFQNKFLKRKLAAQVRQQTFTELEKRLDKMRKANAPAQAIAEEQVRASAFLAVYETFGEQGYLNMEKADDKRLHGQLRILERFISQGWTLKKLDALMEESYKHPNREAFAEELAGAQEALDKLKSEVKRFL